MVDRDFVLKYRLFVYCYAGDSQLALVKYFQKPKNFSLCLRVLERSLR